jgi:penicillin-binding protein 1A
MPRVVSHETLHFRSKQVSKTRRKQKKRAAPPRRRSFKGWLFRIGFKFCLLALLIWIVAALALYAWALTFDLKAISDMPQRSAVYDKDGKFYSRLSGENRIVVPFDKISNDFVNALLAREDRRFYYHHGIDPIGISRAIVRNFIAGGFREGASTITQQLARNSFPLGGKTLSRKLIEAALAYRIETELSKEEILEAYMNRIYFGSGYYGVETASQAYFEKPASRMNLAEAALLAGLIRSPNRFSPFNDLQKSLRERDAVLQGMRQLDFITDTQLAGALAFTPPIPPKPLNAPQENWAMDSILHELELVIDRDPFDNGGLKIYTTIDGTLQNIAETSVRRRLDQVESLPGFPHKPMKEFSTQDAAATDAIPYLEAAALAIDNKTGGVRAIVGGRDYGRSKFNRALNGQRQIGSAVKPFVYAKAFEHGLKPNDRISDNRIRPGDLPAAYGRFDPSNSDNTYRGDLPAADGLVLSRNTMSVRIGVRTGLDEIADTLVRAGLSSHPPRFPSLCLGAFDASLKDLTASYTVFASGGTKLQPYLIERITDADGHILYKATHGRLAVLQPAATAATVSLMEQVLTRGTGAKARQYGLHHRAAGKTGTTNDYRDAWFVGFDDRLTCGVWVGFDLPKKIMPGGTGGELALPIWVDIMESSR